MDRGAAPRQARRVIQGLAPKPGLQMGPPRLKRQRPVEGAAGEKGGRSRQRQPEGWKQAHLALPAWCLTMCLNFTQLRSAALRPDAIRTPSADVANSAVRFAGPDRRRASAFGKQKWKAAWNAGSRNSNLRWVRDDGRTSPGRAGPATARRRSHRTDAPCGAGCANHVVAGPRTSVFT